MKKTLLIILGFILVAAVSAGITFAITSNVYKDDKCECKKDKDKEEKEEKTEKDFNYKKEVKGLCSKVDEEGNFNAEIITEVEDKLDKLEEEKKFGEMWDLVKGKKICQENECMIFEDNDSHNYHYYDCESDEYEVETFEVDEGEGTLSANAVLRSACANVNSKGNYEDKNNKVTCTDFMCDAEIDGKTYSMDCEVALED